SCKVVEEGSNIPLANVQLILFSEGKGRVAESKSGANGSFVIRGLPKGIYQLIALPVDEFTIPQKAPQQITVLAGINVVGINVRLQKGCALKGRVVSNNGIGIPKARVLSKGASSTTDGQGYFTLKGLLPGTIKVGILPVALGTKITTAACEAGKMSDMANTVFSFGPETAIQGTVTDTTGTPLKGAILAASNSSTGGYTFSSDKGTFFLAGLNASDTYTLNVVAFGYEAKTITGVTSPSSNVGIVLTPSLNTVLKSKNYKFAKVKGRKGTLASRLIELVTPNNVIAAECNSCPEGKWWGVSLDVGGLPFINTGAVAYGGSISVGSYYCRSSSANIQFTMGCDYYGVSGTLLSNVGAGVSGMHCWNACCSNDLLGLSNGLFAASNRISDRVAGSVDKSGDTVCGSVSYALSNSFGLWDIGTDELKDAGFKLASKEYYKNGGFIGYRRCDTWEMVNVFEYYCRNFGICWGWFL
ncbi:MAG: carboxypeptidase regulatory-like domain-containing protein, partial [Nitrospirae bacterium]|nr:carboxypeptidase regulatory-like domain-containing protein [Nitrospirota bacterium]